MDENEINWISMDDIDNPVPTFEKAKDWITRKQFEEGIFNMRGQGEWIEAVARANEEGSNERAIRLYGSLEVKVVPIRCNLRFVYYGKEAMLMTKNGARKFNRIKYKSGRKTNLYSLDQIR